MRPHEEMFGATRLAEHAQALARSHTIAPPSRPSWITRRERGPLLSRLDSTKAALIAARDTLARASAAGADVGPQARGCSTTSSSCSSRFRRFGRRCRRDTTRNCRSSPATGALAGYPRIYEIVIELIAHTDGRLDEPSVALMIAEYQRVTPLTMGELWAIPAMLRMGYLENVRRMALRAARDIADRALADEWVSRLLRRRVARATQLAGCRRSCTMARALTPAFLTRFLQQIRSRRPTSRRCSGWSSGWPKTS